MSVRSGGLESRLWTEAVWSAVDEGKQFFV